MTTDDTARQLREEAIDAHDAKKTQEETPVEGTEQRPGVVIFDERRCILAVTPFAEDLVGWKARDVVGAQCVSVFDCQGADGSSVCAQCGLLEVFERREIIPQIVMHIADADGGRRALGACFWYLPPTGNIVKPRAMAVLRSARPSAPRSFS